MSILNYKEHIILALFVAFGIDYYLLNLDLKNKILYYIFIAVGAILPDIDSPKSFIGRIILPLSYIINKCVGHRTLFHSFIFMFGLSLIFMTIYSYNIIWISVIIGASLHILGDLMTPQGVAILYPLRKKRYCRK